MQPDNQTDNPNGLVRQTGVPINAQISGDDRCICTEFGIVAINGAPVIHLCRKLLLRGVDPATPLEAYRGDTLALIIHSIGQAAALEVNGSGRFSQPARRQPMRRGAAMAVQQQVFAPFLEAAE
jgi:hypothetical protein